MHFIEKVIAIFSKCLRSRRVNFFSQYLHPKDFINQFVDCSQTFTVLGSFLAIFPWAIIVDCATLAYSPSHSFKLFF